MEKKRVKDKEFYLNSGKLYSDKNGHNDRRVEFRKYLDKTGVLDRLTRIFIDLYENPVMDFPVIEYIRTNLVIPNPDVEKIAKLQQDLIDEKSFRDHLENENKNLHAAMLKKNNNSIPLDIENQ